LKYLAVDMVVYRLYMRRMTTDAPENIKDAWNNAIKMLKDIQVGRFNLGVETTDAHSNPTLKTNKSTTTSSKNRYYDEDKMDEYDAWLS
jgi:phage gp36-like protein